MTHPQTHTPDVNLSQLTGLIFDCDGVILNSRLANSAFYNHLRKKASMPPLSESEENFVHMSTYEQALDHIFPGKERSQVMGFLDELEDHIGYFDLLEVESGLVPMLDWLKKKNMHLGICTNRLSPLEPLLDRFELGHFFSPLQTASNSRPKPNPDGLLKVLRSWYATNEQIAYIGDSKVDEMAANAAGVPFWSFKNPELNASLHISSFSELHGWLRLALDK